MVVSSANGNIADFKKGKGPLLSILLSNLSNPNGELAVALGSPSEGPKIPSPMLAKISTIAKMRRRLRRISILIEEKV